MIPVTAFLDCHNIVFTVNEPTVSLPTLRRLKECAEKAGLPMGCLTNAYGTEESTETLASIFDFINIGLKGFTSDFYKEYIGVKSVEPILRNIRRLAAIRHVEVTTPVIQGVNDNDLDSIIDFLAGIDPRIPWHIFRLLPEYEMKSAEYPSIEGVGVGDFMMPNTPCINSVDWFYYEPGDGQYLTLTTGKHQVFAYPSGYQYHDENDAKKGWPFSGYFLKVPEHTLGMDFSGKSIAVGNHSMFVHMIFGADICIECFARNLYNQGCLGVIHHFK